MRRCRFYLILLLIVGLLGCSTTRQITPDQTLTTEQERMVVYLKDNRVIKFYPGDYTIHAERDSAYIQGIGRESIDGRVGEKAFRGSIQRSEISEISVTGPTGLTKTMTPVVLGILLLLGLAIYGLATAEWH